MNGNLDDAEPGDASNGVCDSAAQILAAYREKCQLGVNGFLAAQFAATEDLLLRLQPLLQKAPQTAAAVEKHTAPCEHCRAPLALERPGDDLSKTRKVQIAVEASPRKLQEEAASVARPRKVQIAVADSAEEERASAASQRKVQLAASESFENSTASAASPGPRRHVLSLYNAPSAEETDAASDCQEEDDPETMSDANTSTQSDETSEGEERLARQKDRTSLNSLEEFQAAAGTMNLARKSTRSAGIMSMGQAVAWSIEQTLGEKNFMTQKLSADMPQSTQQTGFVYRLVESVPFQLGSMFVIVLNTIFICNDLDGAINSSLGHSGGGLIQMSGDAGMVVDTAFLMFYLIEVVLRMYAHRHMFFCNGDKLWNILDLALVVVSLMALVTSLRLKLDGKDVENALAVRTARLFKIAKLIRVISAMRFFKQLYLFVTIILDCFNNLFWAVMTILLQLLVFSIYFVHGMDGWIGNNWSLDAGEEVQLVTRQIEESFGSVSKSMLTLGATLSGGRDWYDVYRIVSVTGRFDCFVFLTMQAFFHIAVWNIVASVFIETTFKNATVNREDQALAQRDRDERDGKEFFELCQIADENESGTLSLEEFEALMENEDIQDFFVAKGLEVKNATTFFRMISAVNEDGEVPLADFVGACLRLKGAASSIDLQMLAVEHRQMSHKHKKFIPVVQDSLSTMSKKTDLILASLDAQQSNVASCLAASSLALTQLQNLQRPTVAADGNLAPESTGGSEAAPRLSQLLAAQVVQIQSQQPRPLQKVSRVRFAEQADEVVPPKIQHPKPKTSL
eukprot:TRINITY_DN6469_c0_g2_i1.p1 TRINITY_DN6469_c0_g2~~TRINITY_DN6469_c0_g2_i1.p1  ORF type:complete len:795 (-),score=151.94 TRINITY_DN6469_c0_g2_i1:385-2769(-)